MNNKTYNDIQVYYYYYYWNLRALATLGIEKIMLRGRPRGNLMWWRPSGNVPWEENSCA